MRGPIHQTAHVFYEVGYFLISLISRVINAVFYSGSMHQTLSSRAHIEARDSVRWRHIERRINGVFFWDEDHCSKAWSAEVSRARKTLARNGDL